MWPTPVAGAEIGGWSALDRRGKRMAMAVALLLVAGTGLLALVSARSGAGAPPIYGAEAGAARVWSWDGANYKMLPSSGAGPASNTSEMVYDQRRSEVVLWDHGCSKLVMGFTGGCVARANQTWTWDGRGWTARSPRRSPAEAGPGAMIYDSRRGLVLYVNGQARAWAWDGRDWSPLAAGGPAVGRDAQGRPQVLAAGYDEGRGLLVLALAGATWTWDGNAWSTIAGGIDPAEARSDPRLAYDRTHSELLYPGRTATWTWAGGSWQPRPQPFTASGSVAYDGVRRAVLLLQQDPLACDRVACRTRTWSWDGAAWTLLLPPQVPLLPLTRSGAAAPPMAFDEARKAVIVFVSAT